MAECPLCKGKGSLPHPDDDLREIMCRCAQIREIRARLVDPGMALDVGRDLVDAVSPKRSPLLLTSEIDRTQDNLFIQGPWEHILPHLKFVLGFKLSCSLNYRFRIVTDERLLNVYLSKDAYTAKTKETRDSVVSFNKLADLLDPDFDLVILRLGFVAYKNRALPGVLQEALMLREVKERPTWIIEMGSSFQPQPFDGNHKAYSPEVHGYIENRFDTVDLTDKEAPPPRDVAATRPVTTPTSVDEEGNTVVSLGAGRQPEPEDAPYRPRSTETAHSALSGNGGTAYKKRNKSRGGGNPLGE